MENTKGSRLFVRIPAYVIGLLIMTLGVAISVKSNLGVSPVSSIPYTITCVVGLEMGKATILFHAVLVLLQILLLRRAFQAKNLLQIFAGILFGYFTTFCNSLMVFFPDPTNLIVRLAMMLFSTGLLPSACSGMSLRISFRWQGREQCLPSPEPLRSPSRRLRLPLM